MPKASSAKRRPKPRDWNDILPSQVKAEILISVIHQLTCATGKAREAYMRLPLKWRKLAEAAVNDCNTDATELSPEDIQLMHKWFKEHT